MTAAQRQRQAGNAAFAAGEYEQADRLYTDTIDRFGGKHSADMHLLLGNRSAARLRLRKLQGALEDAEAAVSIDSSYAKGFYRQAAALAALGRPTEALAAAERSCSLASTSSAKEAVALASHLRQSIVGAQRDSSTQQGSTANKAAAARADAQQAPKQVPRGTVDVKDAERRRLDAAAVTALVPQPLRRGHVFQHSADGVDENLLVLLHGLGDGPEAYAGLAKQMALPQTASIALPGPLPLPSLPQGYAWFTAFDDRGELLQEDVGEPWASRQAESVTETLRLLEALLETLQQAGGWPRRRIHLFGFSQGGMAALHLAAQCRGEQSLGSCVAVAASLLPQARWHKPLLSAISSDPGSRATPVLITHGDADVMVRRENVISTVTLLNQAAGHPAQLATIPGKGHDMIRTPGEMRQCMQFWAQHLSHRPQPAAPGEEFVEVSTRQPS